MITVRLFARVRETAGRSELQVEAPACTVADLVQRIAVEHPALADLISHGGLLISVNSEFAKPDTWITDGDEVALMPPFSGGMSGREGRRETALRWSKRMKVAP